LTCRYLTQNPGDLECFSKFNNVRITELRSNAEFHKQAKTVMDALGTIVDSLDDLQSAAWFLRSRVRTHHRREIRMAQFEV
jgi:hypothetical protein